jgi:hypothetical protein
MMRRGEEFRTRGEPSSPSSILRRDFGDGPSAETFRIDAVHPRNSQGVSSRATFEASTQGLHCSNARLETETEDDRDPPTFARDDACSQSKVCHEHLQSSPWSVEGRDEPQGYLHGEMAYEETTIDEERCPESNCEDREDQPCDEREEIECDERQSDIEANHCHQYLEEREAISNEFDHDHEEVEFHLLMLQQRDEEEEVKQREGEEMLRRNEEVRVLVVLDELLRIHDEEYPLQDGEGGAAQEEVDVVDLGDADEAGDDLDRLLFLEGTPLSNDAQIEELVALCDRRDRDLEGRSSAAAAAASSRCDDENFPESAAGRREAACIVCLDAPRTHAYVPCGHFCVCFSCAKRQAKQRYTTASAHSSCPVCQQPSTRVMRIFIP